MSDPQVATSGDSVQQPVAESDFSERLAAIRDEAESLRGDAELLHWNADEFGKKLKNLLENDAADDNGALIEALGALIEALDDVEELISAAATAEENSDNLVSHLDDAEDQAAG